MALTILKYFDNIRFLRLAYILTCTVMLKFAVPAQAQINQYSNTTSGAISNAATPCNNALIRNFTVSSTFTVQDANIGVVAAHPYRGDMLMALTSPAGTQVVFNNATGGAADNYNVLADDEAAAALSTHSANDTAASSASAPPYQRNFRPSNVLTAFDGQNAQGTWQLLICDNFAADDGTFYRADLYLTQASRAPGTPPTLSCPAGQTSLDWDVISWTAGATSGNYSITNIGTTNIEISNPGTWLSNATFGGQSPLRQNVVTGGFSPAQFSLFQLVDFASQVQNASTTITLATAVPALQFRIFDVDFFGGQFADRVTIMGSYGGSPVVPTLTNGVANYISGNSAIGDAISGDSSAEGNIVVTFTSPVDSITISYGNHSTAPADPGQQAIALHDLIFCNPQALINITKSVELISDPMNGTTNPKAIPGAMLRYCLLISNAGSAAGTNILINDALPAAMTYLPGSIRSGSSCVSAATAEDEDASGPDESDPAGAAQSGGLLTAGTPTLAAGSSLAVIFDMQVQ
jgi:uncharacterized repeat protein (TIGR01451 family)